MRILQRVRWEDGNYAIVWADVGEDLRAESDYLFLGKEIDYRLNIDKRYCVVCGELADSWRETKEAYCREHAKERLNLCIRNGVTNVNPSCTPESPACERFTHECGAMYVLYFAIGSLHRNIKVGITKEKRVYERAAEQGATALLPLFPKDGYPLFLHEAQTIEALLSGIHFGPGKSDYTNQFFLPHPGRSSREVVPFLLSDPEKAGKRLIENAPVILKLARKRATSKYGLNSLQYKLLSMVEPSDELIKPDYTEFIDAERLNPSNSICKGSFECVSGVLVAVKGEIITLHSGRTLLFYKLSDAVGFAQDKKRRQLKLFESYEGNS
jgi:hypothetical protein